MPTISMFYGISIKMYRELGGRHKIPHLHAVYGGQEAVYGFDGELIEGKLPAKQGKLVEAWILIHEDELAEDWELLNNGEKAFKISPLQ